MSESFNKSSRPGVLYAILLSIYKAETAYIREILPHYKMILRIMYVPYPMPKSYSN